MKLSNLVGVREHLAPFAYLAGAIVTAIPALFYAGGIASGFPRASYAEFLIALFLAAAILQVACSMLAASGRRIGHYSAVAVSSLVSLILGYGVARALVPTSGTTLWVSGFMLVLVLPLALNVLVVLAGWSVLASDRRRRQLEQRGRRTRG